MEQRVILPILANHDILMAVIVFDLIDVMNFCAFRQRLSEDARGNGLMLTQRALGAVFKSEPHIAIRFHSPTAPG